LTTVVVDASVAAKWFLPSSTEDIAQSAIAELTQQGVRAVSTAILVEDALRLAFENQRTVYDTLYVALALNLPAELVTADERLANALGARFPVRWLRAF
jgi:predicted nucleic acid-binding protein